MKECQCSVRIKNLKVKKSGHLILSDVTLSANHGETLALIGKNGAGKTTLLKAILYNKEYEKNIEFFNSKGKKISNPKIGYVPQRLSFDLNTPITVMDLFCANSSSWPVWMGHKKRSEALKLLEKVGVHFHVDSPLGRLSGGELQRVLLAFALYPTPDILLLDEPVSAVDRKGISNFYSIINSMRSDYHMPVILVSHDLGHVVKYASSYALIDHTVVETGSAKNLVDSIRVQKTFGFDVNGGEKLWK